MTPSDFHLWLDGFRAALGNRAPTAEEWALVAEKAGEIGRRSGTEAIINVGLTDGELAALTRGTRSAKPLASLQLRS